MIPAGAKGSQDFDVVVGGSLGYPSDQLHSEIKEGYSFPDCKSHPREIRPRAATRCSVEGSALGRLRALFRVHLKIIRLSGPPALK